MRTLPGECRSQLLDAVVRVALSPWALKAMHGAGHTQRARKAQDQKHTKATKER